VFLLRNPCFGHQFLHNLPSLHCATTTTNTRATQRRKRKTQGFDEGFSFPIRTVALLAHAHPHPLQAQQNTSPLGARQRPLSRKALCVAVLKYSSESLRGNRQHRVSSSFSFRSLLFFCSSRRLTCLSFLLLTRRRVTSSVPGVFRELGVFFSVCLFVRLVFFFFWLGFRCLCVCVCTFSLLLNCW
jgi:hypothetical protein